MYSPDPDEEGIQNEAARQQADLLMERVKPLDDELRMLGLYLSDSQVAIHSGPTGPAVALLVGVQVGDVAFTERVLDPDSDAMNDEFRAIQAASENDAWLDNRNELIKRLREGEDPIADV